MWSWSMLSCIMIKELQQLLSEQQALIITFGSVCPPVVSVHLNDLSLHYACNTRFYDILMSVCNFKAANYVSCTIWQRQVVFMLSVFMYICALNLVNIITKTSFDQTSSDLHLLFLCWTSWGYWFFWDMRSKSQQVQMTLKLLVWL